MKIKKEKKTCVLFLKTHCFKFHVYKTMKEFALLEFILSTEFDIILIIYYIRKTVILKPSLFLLNVMYYPNYIFYFMYYETCGYHLARMVNQ